MSANWKTCACIAFAEDLFREFENALRSAVEAMTKLTGKFPPPGSAGGMIGNI